MSIFKKLVGQTALYGVSSILGRLLNYFLVPLYTALFVAAEYGVVTKVYAYIAVLNVVLTFGMETAYFRFATKNKENEGQSFKHSFGFIFILASIFAVLVFVFRYQLSDQRRGPPVSRRFSIDLPPQPAARDPVGSAVHACPRHRRSGERRSARRCL